MGLVWFGAEVEFEAEVGFIFILVLSRVMDDKRERVSERERGEREDGWGVESSELIMR